MKKIIFIGKLVGFLLIAFTVFAMWYKTTYSMDEARSFVVNTPESSKTLLVATQGSTFKDSLVSGLVAHFRERDLFIKVIDVRELERIEPTQWDAICLIHTWENWKPPLVVDQFVKRSKTKDRLVVLTTSGAGRYKMEEVDAITGASEMANVATWTQEMITGLEAVLAY